MKKFYRLFAAAVLLISILAGCSKQENVNNDNEQVKLMISAAASLQGVLEELKKTYEKEHPAIKIRYNFGGSGTLQQQIVKGAPVDLFLSASEEEFDILVEKGIVDQKHQTNLLTNELVLIVPKSNKKNIQSFEDLTQARKIALGTPETVPAGQYGMETLKSMQIWEDIKSQLVYTKDVRQVLTYTETENVDAGIVYKTDAISSDKVEVISTAAEDAHTPITYPMGIIMNSKSVKETEEFYNFLQSDEAMKIFTEHGFKGAEK